MNKTNASFRGVGFFVAICPYIFYLVSTLHSDFTQNNHHHQKLNKYMIYIRYSIMAIIVIALAVILTIKQQYKYGFIDKNGQVVVEAKFDYASTINYGEGLWGVEYQGKYGFVNAKGEFVITPQYDAVMAFNRGLTAVRKGKKWGYIDKTGKEVCPIAYDKVDLLMRSSICLVQNKEKYGAFNTETKTLIDLATDKPIFFEPNKPIAPFVKNKLYGFVNRQGKVLIPPTYDKVTYFYDGLSRVEKAGYYGFVNLQGKEVIAPMLKDVFPFSQGLAAIKKDSLYGFIDTTGKMRIPPQFTNVSGRFSEGLQDVQKGGQYGLIDTTGKVVVDYQFAKIKDFYKGIGVVRKGNRWGAIDKTGTLLIPAQYDQLEVVTPQLLSFKKGKATGLINLKNEVIASSPSAYPMSYSFSSFSRGTLLVKYQGKYGIMNTSGKMITPPQFTRFPQRVGNVYFAFQNKRYNILDSTGKKISDAIYSAHQDAAKDGRIYVEKFGKSGFVDVNGKLVIDCEYDFVHDFSEGLAVVKKGNKYGYINTQGKIVTPIELAQAFSFQNGVAIFRKEYWGYW